MPEETTQLPTIKQGTPIQTPSLIDKIKIHKFKILAGILTVLVFIGVAVGAYTLGQKQISPKSFEKPTPTPLEIPQATPATGVYHTPGMDFSIDRALKVERTGEKDLLVLTVTFIGAEDSPWPEGTIYQYDTRAFRLVDDEGYVQDMLFSYPTIQYLSTNPISQQALKPGKKDKGEVFFEIPKDKNKFYLTYGKEMTEKILIEPELFDPTANWKTYTNTKYGYSIKYPPEMDELKVKSLVKVLPESYQTVILRLESEWWGGTSQSPNKAENTVVAGTNAKKIFGTQVATGYGLFEAIFPKGNQTYRISFYIGPEERELGYGEDTFDLILSTFKFLEEGKFICPENNKIDCMPIVREERKWFCSEEYLNWAKQNCPKLIITY
jgi:hypothetical protein